MSIIILAMTKNPYNVSMEMPDVSFTTYDWQIIENKLKLLYFSMESAMNGLHTNKV